VCFMIRYRVLIHQWKCCHMWWKLQRGWVGNSNSRLLSTLVIGCSWASYLNLDNLKTFVFVLWFVFLFLLPCIKPIQKGIITYKQRGSSFMQLASSRANQCIYDYLFISLIYLSIYLWLFTYLSIINFWLVI
jgi:hypothetical protein